MNSTVVSRFWTKAVQFDFENLGNFVDSTAHITNEYYFDHTAKTVRIVISSCYYLLYQGYWLVYNQEGEVRVYKDETFKRLWEIKE